MYLLANVLGALARVLDIALTFYMWVIIIRAFISWVNPDPYNPIVQFLYKITEPVLYPFRRMMGTYNIGIDLSPLLAILLIVFLQQALVRSLYDFAHTLR